MEVKALIPITGTVYLAEHDDCGWHVIRPRPDGSGFVVAGPFATQEACERDARRRAAAKSARVYA